MSQLEGRPLLSLGYQALAQVRCGSKTGAFVGGHTCFRSNVQRDYFVLCDCEDCQESDDTTGGSLLLLSQFERHGGNAQRKKPLASIKVTLQDGSSHRDLGTWLDSKCSELGEGIVGRRLEVFWPFEEEAGAWFPGAVTSYDKLRHCHRIEYDDGTIEQLKLSAEVYRWLPQHRALPGPHLLQPADSPASSQPASQQRRSESGTPAPASDAAAHAGQESSGLDAELGTHRRPPCSGGAMPSARRKLRRRGALSSWPAARQHQQRQQGSGGAAPMLGSGSMDGASTGTGGQEEAPEDQDPAGGCVSAGDAREEAAPCFLRQYAQALAAARAVEAAAKQAVGRLAAEVAELEASVTAAQQDVAQLQREAVVQESAVQQPQQHGTAEESPAAQETDAEEGREVQQQQQQEEEEAASREDLAAGLRRENAAKRKALQRQRGELQRAVVAARGLEREGVQLAAKRHRLDARHAALQTRVMAVQGFLGDGALARKLEELRGLVEGGEDGDGDAVSDKAPADSK